MQIKKLYFELFFFLIILSSLAYADLGNITYPAYMVDSFESSTLNKSVWNTTHRCQPFNSACYNKSLVLANNDITAKDGSFVVKYNWTSGDPISDVGGNRTELVQNTVANKEELWQSWSVFIPNNWPNLTFNTPDAGKYSWLILAQWHQFEDAGELVYSPFLSFQVRNNSFYLSQIPLANASYCKYNVTSFSDIGTETLTLLKPLNISRNNWTDFAMHTKFTCENDGYILFYVDNQLLINYTGPVAWNGTQGSYLKTGLYLGGYPASYNWTYYSDKWAFGNASANSSLFVNLNSDSNQSDNFTSWNSNSTLRFSSSMNIQFGSNGIINFN